MFTGLVEEIGRVLAVRRGADSARLRIAAGKVMQDMAVGDSIAVNGVCLTVTSFDNTSFSADVMAETLSKTNLGKLQPGDRVNLERALRLGDRLGGHLVSGHIDGVGEIVRKETRDIATLVTISAPREVMRYIIKKGSVAVDGTSLTVVDHDESTFVVSLIPHTARATVLGEKKTGASVNLEGDMIGKYVERWVMAGKEDRGGSNNANGGITGEFLAKHGFI